MKRKSSVLLSNVGSTSPQQNAINQLQQQGQPQSPVPSPFLSPPCKIVNFVEEVTKFILEGAVRGVSMGLLSGNEQGKCIEFELRLGLITTTTTYPQTSSRPRVAVERRVLSPREIPPGSPPFVLIVNSHPHLHTKFESSVAASDFGAVRGGENGVGGGLLRSFGVPNDVKAREVPKYIGHRKTVESVEFQGIGGGGSGSGSASSNLPNRNLSASSPNSAITMSTLRFTTPILPPGQPFYERKSRVLEPLTVAAPACNYDMRLSCQLEEKLPIGHEDTGANNGNGINTNKDGGGSMRRNKNRLSFQPLQDRAPNNFWRVDLTVVDESKGGGRGRGGEGEKNTTTREIEIEMTESGVQRVLTGAKNNPGNCEVANEAAKQLLNLLKNGLNPKMHSTSHENTNLENHLEPHPNLNVASLAVRCCDHLRQNADNFTSACVQNGRPVEVSGSGGSGRSIFIGAMPCNFHRSDLQKIIDGSGNNGNGKDGSGNDTLQFLSEKTDGVRHLLVINNSRTACGSALLDRTNKAFRPKSRPGEDPLVHLDQLNYSPVAQQQQPLLSETILDGEIVLNRFNDNNKIVFIVFDVLILNGFCCAKLPFRERLKVLQNFFANNTENNSSIIMGSSQLPIVLKTFVKSHDATQNGVISLLKKVHERPNLKTGERMYIDTVIDPRSQYRHFHLTDGIIFQPGHTKYFFGTDPTLLKWKYLDCGTIDVKVNLPNNHHRSNSNSNSNKINNGENDDYSNTITVNGGSHDIDMTSQITLARPDLLRLEADRFAVKGTRGNVAVICEVGQNSSDGSWYYKSIREDKNIANHINTVLGQLLELGEHLSQQELIARLVVNAANGGDGRGDNWKMHHEKMLDDLLKHYTKTAQELMSNQKKR